MSEAHTYDFGRIEPRWQQRWADAQAFRAANPGEPGADKPKFYVLDMFPYPSGAGLHVGHPEGYTATDIVARYKRMRGLNVLHPMGWDAFGLPAEQYAIQTGIHPALTTKQSIDTFRRQLQQFGFSYDWGREFGTIDPEYYKWTQWIFLKIYDAWFNPATQRAEPIATLVAAAERGDVATPRPWREMSAAERRDFVDGRRLVYREEQMVNWCPKLGTVLANDEVIDGRSERGGHPVLRKPLKQWTFRITAYAERLLRQLDDIDWPESTKAMQRDRIGRSEGAEIDFPLAAPHAGTLRVFTTRPDTIFGATWMVVAPEHPLVEQVLARPGPRTDAAQVRAYVSAARNRSDVERMESKTKTGVDLGIDAINPATGAPIPVWTADYVLMGYGTGAIMAVPSGDERDYEFATVFKLPIIPVVAPPAGVAAEAGGCYSGDGLSINSTGREVSLTGLPTAEAKRVICDWLERTGRGQRQVNYKLHDWTFGRQRYWGEPFPIVYTDDGRAWPVSERALPVVLPELADYAPVESDDPQPLLAKATTWARTTAGAAGVDPSLLPPDTPVTRECNTMPGSAGSSWYMLRYCDPRNDRAYADAAALRYWVGDGAPRATEAGGLASGPGVDLYIGGSEHAVGHLLYARFWTNVLHDLGLCPVAEPFRKLFHQGLITSYAYQRADKTILPVDQVREVAEGRFVESATGEAVTPIVTKMSKRYKNVVNPDDVIAQYGADTFRLYEMYMGPLEASKPWNMKDIIGPHRFLQRVWRLVVDPESGAARVSAAAPDEALLRLVHKTIAGVTKDIEALGLNTAIAKLIELTNELTRVAGERGGAPRAAVEALLRLLAPFAPHICEELWERLGHGALLAREAWPAYDEALTRDATVELAVQVNGKLRGRIVVVADAAEATVIAAAQAEPAVAKDVAGRAVKKAIVVKGRLVNLIVG